jgi:tripartite-type tricarboxylate transporter receptor subunit TctC
MAMFRRLLGVLLVLVATAGVSRADWPTQPITFVVPWSAGGGTDAVARIIAAGLEEELGQPVNVVNRTGGGGVIGHSAMATAEPDGYTIGMATKEFSTYYWGARSELTYEDVTPIAQVNFDPAAFHVAADSEWESLSEAIDAIREAPAGTYRIGGGPVGTGWHLALSGLLARLDIDPKKLTVVPHEGAAPGFAELAAGGVHIVPSSLPEGVSMVEAGRVKALAVIDEERTEAFPDVPTVEEALGVAHSGGAWRGIVTPVGVPEEVQTRLRDGLKAVHDSDQFREFMANRGFGVIWRDSDEFGEFLAEDYKSTGEIMGALGIRERD